MHQECIFIFIRCWKSRSGFSIVKILDLGIFEIDGAERKLIILHEKIWCSIWGSIFSAKNYLDHIYSIEII